MKKLVSLLLIIITIMAMCSVAAAATPSNAETTDDTLIIACVPYDCSDNVPLEEAFFKLHPETTIEYRIYSEEHLQACC